MKLLKQTKKIIGLMFLISAFCFSLSACFAEDPFYEASYVPSTNTLENNLNIGKTIKQDALQTNTTVFSQIRDLFGLSPAKYSNSAIAYIQMIVNRALGLVSLISLVIVIFAFYLIFFGKGEEGVAKAKKMLIGVAIALTIMGLSRLIVSYFFFIQTTTAT